MKEEKGRFPSSAASHGESSQLTGPSGLFRDFGYAEGREAHPGEQTFIYTVAVAPTDRRGGVGRALLAEIARRAQEAGDTFLALVPQDGAEEAGRQAFFQACGLTLYGRARPGAAWGCPVSEILALRGTADAAGE
ncbi:GNAT family N-acetyltransferase [Streptomyces hydrogenans]|uniref:GNAT family N-acetyltransferase n=1 Tax=Streptomyces hydrogenans TaxID=1873719 RepID=UPI0036EDED75